MSYTDEPLFKRSTRSLLRIRKSAEEAEDHFWEHLTENSGEMEVAIIAAALVSARAISLINSMPPEERAIYHNLYTNVFWASQLRYQSIMPDLIEQALARDATKQ